MFGSQLSSPLGTRSKRAIVGAMAFIGAALTFLTGIVVTSPDLDKGARALATFAADSGRVQFSWTMDLPYMILMVPALLDAADSPYSWPAIVGKSAAA